MYPAGGDAPCGVQPRCRSAERWLAASPAPAALSPGAAPPELLWALLSLARRTTSSGRKVDVAAAEREWSCAPKGARIQHVVQSVHACRAAAFLASAARRTLWRCIYARPPLWGARWRKKMVSFWKKTLPLAAAPLTRLGRAAERAPR